MPGVWSFVGPVNPDGVFLLVSCQSRSSSDDCRRNPRLGVLFPKSISGRSQTVLPLQRKQYYNRDVLTAALSLTCLEIRLRNEEAINSTQNRIYLLKVFYLQFSGVCVFWSSFSLQPSRCWTVVRALTWHQCGR